MCDFWSSVLLMTGRFKGTPMQVHAAIGGLRATHFVRWIHLFRQTVQEICSEEAAALFIEKAQMIGESLLLGIQTASSRPAHPTSDRPQ
jgi:hemoglobin